MSFFVFIPARYGSVRFEGKPLAILFDKPVIQHVYERSARAFSVKGVFVATDDERIFSCVENFGGKAVMTSPNHVSGTDRIAEAVSNIEKAGVFIKNDDIVVNVQGDEPLIFPEMIESVADIVRDKSVSIGTLARRIGERDEYTNPNIVKVVFAKDGTALYFSRSPVPYCRDNVPSPDSAGKGVNMNLIFCYKHIGVYSFRRKTLEQFTTLKPSCLELTEKLEQLRALENGMKIVVRETLHNTIGVDTPQDLERLKLCVNLFL